MTEEISYRRTVREIRDYCLVMSDPGKIKKKKKWHKGYDAALKDLLALIDHDDVVFIKLNTDE